MPAFAVVAATAVLVFAGAAAVLVLGGGPGASRSRAPGAGSSLPIAQGAGTLPVASGSPLASPVADGLPIPADIVGFERPVFGYQGSLPWQIETPPSGAAELKGYASRPSYLPGQTLDLAVSTTAPTYEVTLWRVSGQARPDSPFRKVAALKGLRGRLQAPPRVDPVTRLVAARWRYTARFVIPRSWPSGMYLARLASSEGVQSYVPFVVLSRTAHAILVVSNALNWQAYDSWGGSSLYTTRVGDPLPGVSRAYGVSFDRPYADDGGAGQLFFLELPLIAWLERQGLDVAYTTDYDLSVAPDAQPLPKVVVFNGHGEYWGVALYGWLDRHVNVAGDLGVALLAADSGYWPVSFSHRTRTGPRDMLCFKDGPLPPSLLPAGASPEPSEAPEPSPPAGDTEERSGTALRALGPAGPYLGSFADQPLFGVRYRGITSVLGRYTLEGTGADPRLLAGTGLAAGSSLGFIAGGEVDGVYPFAEWWGPLQGQYDHRFAGAAEVPGRGTWRWTAEAVWRELPSGGRVFSSGTFYWGWALDPSWGPAHEVPATFGLLTLNILRFLGGG